MKAVSIVGDADTEQIAESLADHLAEGGTVGRVRRDDEIGQRGTTRSSTAPHRSVRLSGDGHWTASGDNRTLDAVLDRLAVSCDYVVVEGHPEADLPKVVVGEDHEDGDGRTDGDAHADGGDRSNRQDVLASGETAEEIDETAVIDGLATRDPYETLESLVAQVKESADEQFAGAIATFTGRVRAKDHEDDEYTEYLEFERYDGVAEEKMQRLREELEAREGVYEVRLHHRTGVVEAGEDIVFVVVLAGHRTEAFRTVEDGIDRLKEKVPLFKKEVTVDGEFWAHTGQRE